MSQEAFHANKYKSIVQEYIRSTINYLLESGIEFSLTAQTRYVSFDPQLPSSISNDFKDIVLFVMAGYTFESSRLDGDAFVFEAGFGVDGFGSKVTTPLLSIKQIFVDDYPILVNITEPIREKAVQTKVNKSMEALLNNPKNKNLLKK